MTPPLITERTVRDAASIGRLPVPAGAVITPAARDLARELGVTLEEGTPSPPPPGDKSPASNAVAIGADHGGVKMKEALIPVVEKLGRPVLDLGTEGEGSVDYPLFAARVAEAVAAGEAEFGIMVDGAGIGSAMVANKIPGARAAMCYDRTTAQNAREHNNANVLTLGGTLIGHRLAGEIVQVFLTTPFGGGRHARRVAMIDALDSPAS